MDEYIDDSEGPGGAFHPKVAVAVVVGVGVLMIGAVVAVMLLRPAPSPASAEVANDPMLAEGRELFLWRCASCHGQTGSGDGPIARSLQGPPPGDLTDDDWTHGDRPDQVVAVISEGVQGTAMAPWKTAFRRDQIRAVAAYVYYLAGRPVPDELREGR